jgi:hypothetical protein
MKKMRWVLALAAIVAIVHTANATYIPGTPDRWSTPVGDFTVTTFIAGGGSNAISATYDASTEIFQLTSNYLPGLGTGLDPIGNVALSLTAIVDNTGQFQSGVYSMLVGPAGVSGLALPTGAPLISGHIVELASTWFAIQSPACGGTTCFVSGSEGRTPALLALDFAAPELGLTTDHLTLYPFVDSLSGIFPENPWSRSFEGRGFLGWTLWETVEVPEPGTLALLSLGLLGVVVVRLRQTSVG